MGFAKTDVSLTAGFAGTITFYQCDAFKGAPMAGYASVSGAGGVASYAFSAEQRNDYDPIWANFLSKLTGTVGGMPPVSGTVTVGDWHISAPWVPPTPPAYVYTGSASIAEASSGTLGPLYLHKSRDLTSELPSYDSGPSSACHPLHGAMFYAWGCTDGDTYATTINSGLSDTGTSGNTMEPAHTKTDAGTRDLPNITVAVGINANSPTTRTQVEGLVMEWSGLTLNGEAVDLSGFRDPVSGTRAGCYAIGGNGTLSLYCLDKVAAGASGFAASAWVNVPVTVAYYLRLYDWAADYGTASVGDYTYSAGYYSGQDAPFRIADDSGIGTKLAPSSYEATITYTRNSWDGTRARIWSVAPYLDPDWLDTYDELVDPDDGPCVINERGLTMGTGIWSWGHFGLGRYELISVQFPSDAVSWPSTWGSVDPGMTVTNAGAAPWTTTVTVAPGASNAAILRTLEHSGHDNILATAAYGWPDSYLYWVHSGPSENGAPASGEDVWCWMQYPIIRLDYDSELAGSLTLTVTYATLAVDWSHVTNEDPVLTWTTGKTVTATVPIVAAAGQSVYVDLAAAADRNMMRVDSIQLSGFSGTAADWDFVLSDLVLVAAKPDGSSEVGKCTFTSSTPRPGDGGLPIHYQWHRCTCDGQRAWDEPDKKQCLADDNGIIGVRYTRSPSGIIGDAMMELRTLYGHAVRLEGMMVDGVTNLLDPTPQCNCVAGHAEYDDDFLDADDNDMLGGELYCGDVAEVSDQAVPSDGTNYVYPGVCPRVGVTYLASGTTIPCTVLKYIHGNLHGCVRTGSVRTEGADVWQWEQTVGGAEEVPLGSEATDAWGRWSRASMIGARENRRIGASTTDDSTTVLVWKNPPYNTLRYWVGGEVSGDLRLWYPHLDKDHSGIVWRVAANVDGVLYVQNLPPIAATAWSTATSPFDGNSGYTWPSIACTDSGILVAATYGGSTLFARSRDGGLTWQTVATATLGSGLTYGTIWHRWGHVVLCGHDATDDIVKLALSSNEETLVREYLFGTTELVDVVAAAASGLVIPKSAVCEQDAGSYVVLVEQTSGTVTEHLCLNPEDGFTEATGDLADSLRWGGIWHRHGHTIACGSYAPDADVKLSMTSNQATLAREPLYDVVELVSVAPAPIVDTIIPKSACCEQDAGSTVVVIGQTDGTMETWLSDNPENGFTEVL